MENENPIEEAKLIQSIEANDKLETIGKNTEASILVQDETKEAIKDLQTPLDAIMLNTEPKEIQKVQLVSDEESDEMAIQFFSMLKGKKGDKPTDEEITALIKPLIPSKSDLTAIIEPLIPEPIKGADGEDYVLTSKDKSEIASLIEVPIVEKIIEKTETIIEKPITIDKTKTVIKEVAKYEEAEQIAEKVNTLSKAIDFKVIKNFPDFKNNGGNGIGYIREASDVSISDLTVGQGLVWNGSAWVNGTVTGGASAFIDLTDVPNSYSGQAGKAVRVKATEDGLEFFSASGTGTVTSIATAGLISGGTITTTGTITTSMATNKLVGRGTAGTGVMEEITLGTGLSFTGTTLNATAAITGSDTQVLFFDGANNPAGEAGLTYNKTTDALTVAGSVLTPEVKATSSAGVDIHNNSGTQVALFGAGGGTGSSLVGTTNIGSASADYIQVAGGTGATTFTATGSSTDIDITAVPKGTGKFKVTGDVNISGLTASKVVFTDASKNLTSTGIGNSTDFIKGDGSLDGSTYLTGNQTIALSGDVSGTGSTSITTTIGAGVVGIAMLSATGTPSATTFLRGDNTWATPAGSGTVTNTGGNLTANSVVLGAGTSDVKVVAGVTTNGAGQLVLGVNATTLGNVKMFGSTSGDVTFGPAAVAGTATVFTLPPDNGTNGYYLKTNGSGVTTWAAATGGLTNWTEALTTAAPNATINVSSFTATNGTTHQDAAFIPKGSSGSVIVAIPDNTTTGGNKRGTASVDLQLTRTAASQVVSGSYSFGVGARNTVSGDWSGAIGFNNNVSGYSSFAAGESNTVSNGPGMAVGSSNTVSGIYSAALGRTHTVSGINSFAYGESNTASTSYTFAGGLYADAYLYGMRSTASGRFAAVGDAQAPDLVWRRSITGTSATELFLDGASIRAILKSGNTVWNATIQVVATIQTVGNGTVTLGDSFVGTYAVGIKRIGSSTALIGTVDTVSGDNDTGMAGAAVTITADDTNEALKIEFTPPTLAGTTTVTRVVARGTIAEVRY